MSKKYKVQLFVVGVDSAKELIYSRLKIDEPGPGYMHFNFSADQEYFKQMCAEKCITKYVKGFPRREWVKLRHRNEALDCEVYAIAALTLLNININQLADRLDRQPKGPTKDAVARKRGIISRGIE